MAAKESFSIDGCVQKVLGKLKKFGITKLSVCQSKALRFFLSGYDTFAVLPTGHGKSLIYQMAALISKEKQADPVIFSSRFLDGFERLSAEATFRTPANTAKM